MKKKRLKIVTYVLSVLMAVLSCGPQRVQAADSLDVQIEQAEGAIAAAEENYEAVKAQYDRGCLGFVEWMLQKDNLTDAQKKDLNAAKKVYEDAMEESFLLWADGDKTGFPSFRNDMVVCLGDAGDGISISSAKYALPMLYSINEKRRTDDIFVGAMKRRDSYVNFYLMAVAQTGANRGAGLRDHSRLSVSCENLAFGYSDAVNMWYREKSNFEATMSSLGMEALTSEADLKMVEDNNTKIIGHYTNLFLTDEQVMGVGFCQYGAAASCYNAHRNLKSSGYEYYTVDAYVALFNEYCETVDIKGAKEAVDAAKAALEQLKQQKYAKCTGHSFVSKSHFDATCTQDGGDLYECSKCGKPEYRNVVEAPGHTMVDGVCSVCSVTGPKTMNDIYITYDGKKQVFHRLPLRKEQLRHYHFHLRPPLKSRCMTNFL